MFIDILSDIFITISFWVIKLVNLSEIVQESGELGVMELEIFKFHINSLKEYQKDLILVK